MGRSRSRSSSSSDDERDRERGDRRRDDRYRDRDRDRRRRSRSRSNSPSRRGGSSRKYDSGRDRDSARRVSSASTRGSRAKGHHGHHPKPSVAAHFGPPAIDQQDFDNWVQILTKCEQSEDLDFVREKYDAFLERYPYCYGFWTKYAEYERRFGSLKSSCEVWERGIISVPLSVDLWLGYITQMKMVPDFPTEKIRELYERALEIAGVEYQSDRLWLDAIGFEQVQYVHEMCSGNEESNCRRIGELFDRLLATPTLHALTHFDRYVAYLNTVQPDLLLSEEEFNEIFKIARKDINRGIDELSREVDNVYHVKMLPDGKTLTLIPVAEEGSTTVNLKRTEYDDDVLRKMRNEIMTRRRVIFEKNVKMCELRAPFEANIKRPYFHVKPLDNVQLFNWISYLDFEIKEGDDDRIKILFERCLIACALYEEFWIKYARWAWRAKKSKSSIREIFKRAKVHIPRSLNIALAQSGFEESIEDFDGALNVLDKYRREHPGYVLLELRYLGILRRKCDKEGSSSYSPVVSAFEKLISKSETSINLTSFYSLKLARFHLKVRKDAKMAQKVIRKAMEKDGENLQLYTQLVDIAYSAVDMKEDDVVDAFDLALTSNLRIEDKIRFSQRKLDYLEELGMDILTIEEHREYHYHLLAQLPETTPIRTKFSNDPSRMVVVPQAVPPQPVMWQMQQPPPMNMGMPMMMAPPPQHQQFIAQAPPMQPKVHLQILEPNVAQPPPTQQQQPPAQQTQMAASDGSSTPME